MKAFSHERFRFGGFEFDAGGPALWCRGELVEGVQKKPLEVLAVLLRHAERFVPHDEIIEFVWDDNPHGVTPARVNGYVSKLQKIFKEYDPDSEYIKNLRGRGYRFTGEVERIAPAAAISPRPVDQVVADRSFSTVSKAFFTILALGLVTTGVLAGRWYFYPDHEKEVMQVVKESQLFESLVLYKQPDMFEEKDLDRFWTPELDVNANYDRSKIRTAVAKLVADGRRYGDETKCEQLEFQSVEVDVQKETAIVKTLEKWFIAEYRTDGSLIKNKHVGPYFVSYVLKNLDGRWLIEKSNTARANLTAPRLAKIAPRGNLVGGRQSFVDLVGEDFLHEVVFVKVVGEGCPEFDPCTVPNAALRDHAKFSQTLIENVPLTLASGEYFVTVQNGNSKASEPVTLVVP